MVAQFKARVVWCARQVQIVQNLGTIQLRPPIGQNYDSTPPPPPQTLPFRNFFWFEHIFMQVSWGIVQGQHSKREGHNACVLPSMLLTGVSSVLQTVLRLDFSNFRPTGKVLWYRGGGDFARDYFAGKLSPFRKVAKFFAGEILAQQFHPSPDSQVLDR